MLLAPECLQTTFDNPAVDDHGVKLALGNSAPYLRSVAAAEARNTGLPRDVLQELIPISIEQRYIPLKLTPKPTPCCCWWGIWQCEHREIQLGCLSQLPQPGHLVLNRMGGDDGNLGNSGTIAPLDEASSARAVRSMLRREGIIGSRSQCRPHLSRAADLAAPRRCGRDRSTVASAMPISTCADQARHSPTSRGGICQGCRKW